MKKLFFLFAVIIIAVKYAIGQELDNGKIPFYAPPYYNYKPLKVKIGKFSKELETKDTKKLLDLADSFKADIDNIRIEAMYILSIRLYDIGEKDKSFYWFQTAKLRGRIFVQTLDNKSLGAIGSEGFELKQLFSTINLSVGGYINGYGFNDFDRGIATYETVVGELKNVKPFSNVYSSIKFVSDAMFEEAKAQKIKELETAVIEMKATKEEIIKKRIEAGIQGKY